MTRNNGRSYNLRVDLRDWENNATYAEYSAFSVAGDGENNRMTFDAFVGGSAGT